MRTEDLQLISTLGQALYADPSQAQSRSLETVAAVSTLAEVSDEQFLERALGLMLHQAERDGLRANRSGVSNPFFRLSPKERFVLFLLHSGRASYKRLSRLMGISVEDIQTLAWIGRTQIASSPEVRLHAPHPTGSSHLKHSCPEYDSSRPWTQRLLDDEMNAQDLAFIQNHTSICSDCNRSLRAAREFYYGVEKLIPMTPLKESAEKLGEQIKRALRKNQLESGSLPRDLTVFEALSLFFKQRENIIWAGIAVTLIFGLTYFKSHLGLPGM